MKSKEFVESILNSADIKINGTRPWDVQVHNDKFYDRVISQGSLGLGEAYMDGWWDCGSIDELVNKILIGKVRENLPIDLKLFWKYLTAFITNKQNRIKSKEVIEVHYDLGNDLYERMLDKRMVYTCGYWANAADLDSAQEAKLDLVCRKLRLKPGMRILDIGCGFGSFLKYAAEKYGVSGVGITLSKEQLNFAKKSCEGLPIEIRLQDYRDVNEPFDAIASIGMFEAVGHKNFEDYMKVAERCLPDHGLFLLHTIGSNSRVNGYANPWIDKYIFPNGELPTISNIGRSISSKFVMEDWHNFGPDYDKTLLAWRDNFEKRWEEIAPKYGKRFYRMWQFYLLMCAGSFRARNIQLWQIVLSKDGAEGGYRSPR